MAPKINGRRYSEIVAVKLTAGQLRELDLVARLKGISRSEVLRRGIARESAAELDAALRGAADTELTLDQAASESGYSKRRLRELIASEDLPNAGRKGAPRIRRRDLPRKPRPAADGFDDDAEARKLVAP